MQRNRGSNLSSLLMSKHLILPVSLSPTILSRKLISAACIYDLIHLAHGHRWVLEHRVVKRRLCLLAHLPFTTKAQCYACITSDKAPICLSVSYYILPSLLNQTQRYIKSFTWCSNLLPIQREQYTVFQLKTIATDSDNGDSDFYPTTSHLVANHSIACWRLWSNEVNSTTQSAKRRSLNQTLCSPDCVLRSLSMKIKWFSCDFPCQSVTRNNPCESQ